MAQLAERSFPTPEIRGLNPNIGKVLSAYCKLNRKDVNKEKEARNGPSLKNVLYLLYLNLCRLKEPLHGYFWDTQTGGESGIFWFSYLSSASPFLVFWFMSCWRET